MSDASVVRVGVENITPLWPEIEDLITKALCGRPTHDAEDVRRMLMGHVCQLWVQRSETTEALVVSEFATYPKGIWVRAWLGAARDESRMDTYGFSGALLVWSQQHGCRGLEAQGRLGWLRRFPEAQAEGQLMRITVR